MGVAMLVAGLALLAMLAWVATQPGTLKWAADKAHQASGGRLIIEGVDGSLLGPMRAARLAWDEPEGDLWIATDVSIDGWPRMLLRRQWRVARLSADTLTFVQRSTDRPSTPPATLALPWPVQIDDARIDRVQVVQPAGVRTLTGLRASAVYRDGRYVIDALSVDSPWGRLSGHGTLADTAPYALAGSLSVDARVDGLPAPLVTSVSLSGDLTRIQVRATTRIGESNASLEGSLMPWSERPVGPLALEVDRVDPQRFLARAPRAALRLRAAVAVPSLPARGTFELFNDAPGLASAGRLPLSVARGAFTLSGQSLVLEGLQLTFDSAGASGAAGRAEGSVRIDRAAVNGGPAARPQIRMDLAVRGLDASRWWQGLLPTRLDGRLRLDPQGLDLDLQDPGRLLAGGLSVRGRLALAGHRLMLQDAELKARDGVVRMTGSLALDATRGFELSGSLRRFDIRRWHELGRFPVPATFDGEWQAKGTLGGEPRVTLVANVHDGKLAALPLSGTVALSLIGRASQAPAGGSVGPAVTRVHGIQVRAQLGGLRIRADGALGLADDSLTVSADAPSLTSLDARLAGRARMQAQLRGGLFAPTASLMAEVSQLRMAGIALDTMTLRAEGDPGAHRASLAASGRGQRLRLATEGVLDMGEAGWRWRARLLSLDAEGLIDAALREPATLWVDAEHARIDGLDLTAFDGRIQAASLAYDGARLAVRGARADLSIDPMVQAWRRWQPETLDRELPPPGGFRLKAAFEGSAGGLDDVTGQLEFDSESSALQARSRGRIRADAGVLSGALRLQLPSLSFARRVMGDDWRVAGAILYEGTLSGRVRSPRLTGTLSGRGLALAHQATGWRLADGTLDATLEPGRLVVRSMRFASGGGGSVSISGTLNLPDDPAAVPTQAAGDFALVAQRLALSIGPGQRMVLGGTTALRLERGVARWTGRLVADEGFIELSDLDSPSQPEDLVIVDRRRAQRQAPAGRAAGRSTAGAARGAAPPALVAAIDLDLGQRFRVSGSGVDAWLNGTLALAGTLPEVPRASGTVTLRDGRFRAYGQSLVIDRGRLVFDGPFDNPALDIVALRKTERVQAGIALGGTAQSPRVRLVSVPELSDAEKLSWLVLGVGLDDASSGAQVAALKAAAASLAGGSDRAGILSGGLAGPLGLDVLSVRGATSTSAPAALPGTANASGLPPIPGASARAGPSSSAERNVVAIGKRLGSRLFVSYEQGLRGVWNLVNIQYDLTRHLSIRALTGSETAIDLLYSRSYD